MFRACYFKSSLNHFLKIMFEIVFFFLKKKKPQILFYTVPLFANVDF